MAELARNSSDRSMSGVGAYSDVAVQVNQAFKQTTLVVKSAPATVIREVARMFIDAVFGRHVKGKLSNSKGDRSDPATGGQGGAVNPNAVQAKDPRDPKGSQSNSGFDSSTPSQSDNQSAVIQRNKEAEPDGGGQPRDAKSEAFANAKT